MANANDWATDLENTVTALVKAKTLTQLKKTYPKIVITNEGENSGQAVFPTVYNAVVAAMSEANNNVNITLQGDADKLFTMVQDKANNYTNMTGQAAFPY